MSSENLSKEALRKKYQALRNHLTSDEQDKYAKNAAEIFLENIKINKDSIVAGYYPANNEITPLPILDILSSKNIVTALPVIKGKNLELDFQKWKQGDELYRSSFFKIQEPRNESVTPDVVIVPLLAFDNTRHRLGYGGGFYDRTLQHLKSIGHKFISVGYAYSFQKTGVIPTHDGDVELDCIVTDKEFITKLSFESF